MSNSMRPYGLQPTRLLCPQDSPGKNIGVGCHAFLHYWSIVIMLCQFLLYSKVKNQLYVYIQLLYFQTSFPLGHHRALNRVPCHIQQVFISYLFYTQQCIYVDSNLPIYPTPPFPLGIHKFVLYVCVCFSALQTSLSVPFLQISHISSITQYLFFPLSDLLHSV